MIYNLGRHKIIWLITALLALAVSLAGVLAPQVYSQVVSHEMLPGTISQDMVAAAASLLLLLLLVGLKERHAARQIVILGLLGFYFYAYGIYAIERVYNLLYFAYLAIFGLAFWGLVYGLASLRRDVLEKVSLPNLLRRVSVGFSLLMPLIFYPLWIGRLLPLLRTGTKIEFLYSVFIIDLCFIMPAFIIVAVKSARREGLGLVLTPAMYVLSFSILFPLSLGEVMKPLLYDLPLDPGGFWLFLVLSLAFLVLSVACLMKLEFELE